MRTKQLTLLICIILMTLFFSGCYTVVMVPKNTSDYVYQEYQDGDEEEENMGNETYSDETDIEHNYYIYGDLWPGYVNYDPFWASPYWMHYPSWHSIHYGYYDPWYGDSYWPSYGYRPYHNYPSFYCGLHYYDPYDVYWDGYYGGNYYGGNQGYRVQKKQPFTTRGSLIHGLSRNPVSQSGSSSMTSVLSKNIGSDSPSSTRVGRRMASVSSSDRISSSRAISSSSNRIRSSSSSSKASSQRIRSSSSSRGSSGSVAKTTSSKQSGSTRTKSYRAPSSKRSSSSRSKSYTPSSSGRSSSSSSSSSGSSSRRSSGSSGGSSSRSSGSSSKSSSSSSGSKSSRRR